MTTCIPFSSCAGHKHRSRSEGISLGPHCGGQSQSLPPCLILSDYLLPSPSLVDVRRSEGIHGRPFRTKQRGQTQLLIKGSLARFRFQNQLTSLQSEM